MIPKWHTTLVQPARSILEVMRLIDASSLQIGLVVDDENRLLGTVTDGDIRRGLLRGVKLESPVEQIMHRTPLVASPSEPLTSRRGKMRVKQIRHLPLLDTQNRVVGLDTLESLENSRYDNWVVLMAGGRGVRLRPLTDERPKPMLEVGGRPILETILERFISHGFWRFFISINYRGDLIEKHFEDGARWGATISYLREEQQLGTAGALGLLPERPSAPVVAMNGDLLTSVHLGQMLDFHEKERPWATMAVRQYDFQVPYGVVRIDNQRLVGFDEKPVHCFFVNAGIYILDPQALALLPPGEPCDMPTLFQSITSQGHQAMVFPIREYWTDIGQLDDFKRAQDDFDGVFGGPKQP